MKLFRSLLVAFPALLIATLAGAQTGYPDKPVRIFVGFTPGSATDITARAFAQKFNEAWNVPVTVENVPGAAGSVAADRVSKSAPDGYTLYWGANGALTINPSLQVGSAFDPARDLAPVARLLVMPSILAVNNDVPAKSVQELIALAKAQPGKLSYASPGVGTPQHIGGELFKALAGVDIVHVPYRGAIFIDVIGARRRARFRASVRRAHFKGVAALAARFARQRGGRVSMTWQNIGAILPTVRGGQLRGIAVTSLKRSPNTPDLPTISESGIPNFESISWFGLLAPAGTPAPIVSKLYQEASKIAAQPDMRARFAQLGLDTVGNPPDEFAAIIKSDTAKWAKVIRDAGIKASE